MLLIFQRAELLHNLSMLPLVTAEVPSALQVAQVESLPPDSIMLGELILRVNRLNQLDLKNKLLCYIYFSSV